MEIWTRKIANKKPKASRSQACDWLLSGAVAFLFLKPCNALAGPLTMGVSSALPDAQNAQQNPALAGAMDQTEVMAGPSISIQNNFLVRYPDSGTIEKSLGIMGDLTSFIPAFIYKVNPRLGIGITEIAPPLKLNQKITGVPIVLLHSTQKIDINADVTLRGALGGVVGYRLSDYISLGAKFNYRSVMIDADVVPEGGGEALAKQHADQTTTTVTAGVLLEPIPNRLRVGLSTKIFGTNTSATSVESAFVAQQNSTDGTGKSTTSATGTFSEFVAGGAFHLSPRRFIAADVDYKAADPTAKEFSMVDFKEKPVDGYARLNFRMAGEWAVSRTASMVGGFALENSGKGSGSRSSGDDAGKAGFASTDVIQIYTGQASLTPAQSFMGGMKLYFLNEPKKESEKKEIEVKGKANLRHLEKSGGDKSNDRSNDKSNDRSRATGWIVGFGIGYRNASLGIDDNGELPGAYQQTRIYIPIEITRRF